MQGEEPRDILPLWPLLVLVLLIVLVSAACGYRLGKRVGRPAEEKDSPLGKMVGATLGLLAFLLAFTFGLAASRYDTRRKLQPRKTNCGRARHPSRTLPRVPSSWDCSCNRSTN
jgi:CDP-diglyceride synthetase